jgi:hypothetical protein
MPPPPGLPAHRHLPYSVRAPRLLPSSFGKRRRPTTSSSRSTSHPAPPMCSMCAGPGLHYSWSWVTSPSSLGTSRLALTLPRATSGTIHAGGVPSGWGGARVCEHRGPGIHILAQMLTFVAHLVSNLFFSGSSCSWPSQWRAESQLLLGSWRTSSQSWETWRPLLKWLSHVRYFFFLCKASVALYWFENNFTSFTRCCKMQIGGSSIQIQSFLVHKATYLI